MLRQNIKPGESCFIYGSAPVLYTLLKCKNPTLVDTTYSDFYTLNNIKKPLLHLEKILQNGLLVQLALVQLMIILTARQISMAYLTKQVQRSYMDSSKNSLKTTN
ncbi:MAG: hypothetical protein N4J56_005210 [Chroococcidiopsis sp. SAG 2025]|nr:hypothetical protein [Chroococcidiopsis sp. SAG 2025]